MEKQLLSFLNCPICQSEFSLINCSETTEIISGHLVCSKKHYFTVKNGVPILRQDLATTTAAPVVESDCADFNQLTSEQRTDRLRPLIESLINFSKAKSARAKKSLEDDITYRLHYSRKD